MKIFHNLQQTYSVNSINIQSNFCKLKITIPNNILYLFSECNELSCGDLIEIHPQNVIWCKILDSS